MDIKSFIKNKIGELLILFSVPLLYVYLIPFPYFFISISLSWISSFTLVYYQSKESKRNDQKCATQSFLVSFYGQLCQQATFKQSYEISLKYLNTFYPTKTYEEMVEDPSVYNLDKESAFLYALDKEKNNEGMLLNYSYLYDEKEKFYNNIVSKKEKRERMHKMTLATFSFSIFSLVLVFVYFPNIKESLQSIYYLLGSLIGLTFTLPVLEVDQYLKLKKENENEK